MIRTRKNGLCKMLIAVVIVFAALIIMFLDDSFTSEAANLNVEQQNTVTAINSSGIKFNFDDNYTLLTKDYIPNNNKTYYFSTSGNDKNNGLSAKRPKKNPYEYFSKDNVNIMLKAGDTFKITFGTSVGTNVNIGTYGGDQRAIIDLSLQNKTPLHCVDKVNNIYSAVVDSGLEDIGHLIIDNRDYWAKLLTYEMKNDEEYYYDRASKTIYIKSNANLEGKKFTITSPCNAFLLKNSANTSIHNLEIKNAGIHGIRIINGCSNVQIVNCYVHEIGGMIGDNGVKFGNGIEVWPSDCNNIYICNNIIENCFDAGLTAQVNCKSKTSDNIVFANNIVNNCNYGFEFFQFKSNPVKNVVFANNAICSVKDITNGYRLTQSKTDYTSALNLWYSDSQETSVKIVNNFTYSGSYYGLSFSSGTTKNVYSYANNTFMVDSLGKKVNNPKNYFGDQGQFVGSKSVSNIKSFKAFVDGNIK